MGNSPTSVPPPLCTEVEPPDPAPLIDTVTASSHGPLPSPGQSASLSAESRPLGSPQAVCRPRRNRNRRNHQASSRPEPGQNRLRAARSLQTPLPHREQVDRAFHCDVEKRCCPPGIGVVEAT